MMEFILQALLIWLAIEVAYFVFRVYRTYQLIQQQRQQHQQVSELVQDLREHYKIVYTETVDDVILMYESMTNNFVCQASTEQELWVVAQQRFPDKKFVLKDSSNHQLSYEFVK
jgi:DNA-dependent RNA polymerase auxiliary subunit epsilon